LYKQKQTKIKEPMSTISINYKISREAVYLERYLAKQIDINELSNSLNKSVRTCYRKIKRFSVLGEEGLKHRLIGQEGNRKLNKELYSKTLEFLKEFLRHTNNSSHIKDFLEEKNINLSATTLRKIIRENNLVIQKMAPENIKRAYSFRTPKNCFGELIQLDTSYHNWFGEGKCNLIVMIDDSTSKIVYACFEEHDGTLANLRALHHVIEEYGIPKAIYTDKASWFYSTQSDRSKLKGKKHRSNTQWEQSLNKLGIQPIVAHSSQAKGRVERVNRTLQDRLVTELKMHNIQDIEAANKYLQGIYLKKHNNKFSHAPAVEESVFVKKNYSPSKLKIILAKKYEACVRNDNTIRLEGGRILIQLEKTPFRHNWARAQVVLIAQIDGALKLLYKKTEEEIPFTIINFKPFKERKYSYNEFEEAS
jgi:transposase